jgi:hypothetical protein
MKILVSDSLSKQGVEVLEKAGFTVVVKTKLPKEELLKEIKDADGLIVRSGTKVTAEVIAAAQSAEGRRASRFRLGQCRYPCCHPSRHRRHEYAQAATP